MWWRRFTCAVFGGQAFWKSWRGLTCSALAAARLASKEEPHERRSQEWNLRNPVWTSKQDDQEERTQQKSSKDVVPEDCLIRRESEQRQCQQHQEGNQPKLEADCCKLLPTCW
mmetsp:Transcript_105144/g.250327  ORF Transcript_105144/g.250327 Transcript_105144/m.250327 type:complete len:113 (+) Transcript_105144:76-414(+)